MYPESPRSGIPTVRNPHCPESPPEFHDIVGIQDSGDSGPQGTEYPLMRVGSRPLSRVMCVPQWFACLDRLSV